MSDEVVPERRLAWVQLSEGEEINITWPEKPMRREVWEEFASVIQLIADIRPLVVDLLGLEMDFAELVQVEGQIVESMSTLNAWQNAGSRGAVTLARSQSKLTAFLGAASAFRDHIVATLTGASDGTEDAVKSFKSATSAEFDSSQAYRIMYGLRNFAQHEDAPLSAVPVSGKRTGTEDWAYRVELALHIRRLADSDKFNSKVRQEMQTLPDKVPLMPLVKEFMASHRRLAGWMLKRHERQISTVKHYQQAVLSHPHRPTGSIPIMIEGPSMHLGQQDEHNRNYSYFGFDEIALIDRMWERLEMPDPAILTVQDLLNLTEPVGLGPDAERSA